MERFDYLDVSVSLFIDVANSEIINYSVRKSILSGNTSMLVSIFLKIFYNLLILN